MNDPVDMNGLPDPEHLFVALEAIHEKPEVFSRYTAAELWTDEHISSRMLECHLDPSVNLSSRKIEFIERSAAWMTSEFGLGPEKGVADFGCGPGLYTSRLAQSGASVTGIDFSKRSIRYAREQDTENRVRYVLADYLDYEPTEKFDLIIMIMCDFGVLSPSQRNRWLQMVHSCLAPDGHLLFDVLSVVALEGVQERTTFAPNLMSGFWSAAPYYGFSRTFKYPEERVGLDKYTIVEASRQRTIYNWLQYYDRESLTGALSAQGFEVDRWLGNVAGDTFSDAENEFAVIARKSSSHREGY